MAVYFFCCERSFFLQKFGDVLLLSLGLNIEKIARTSFFYKYMYSIIWFVISLLLYLHTICTIDKVVGLSHIDSQVSMYDTTLGVLFICGVS